MFLRREKKKFCAEPSENNFLQSSQHTTKKPQNFFFFFYMCRVNKNVSHLPLRGSEIFKNSQNLEKNSFSYVEPITQQIFSQNCFSFLLWTLFSLPYMNTQTVHEKNAMLCLIASNLLFEVESIIYNRLMEFHNNTFYVNETFEEVVR